MSNKSMSDEDAQKEFDEIQAEIAKEKGIKPDEKKEKSPEEKDGEREPDHTEENKEEIPDKTPPEDEGDGVDRKPEGRDDRVPLSKYQETKKTLEQTVAEKNAEIEKLKLDLNRATTSKAIGEKVKSFSEKHGMPEEAVLELVELVKGETALNPETSELLEKSRVSIQKQEALEKFESELQDFFADVPEAAEHERELRAKAFEKDNLDKSLFEIYHRNVRPSTEKRKTGESSRGSGRSNTQSAFDPSKVIEKINAGTPGAFNGLSNEQIDQVFATMEKQGSRYINR